MHIDDNLSQLDPEDPAPEHLAPIFRSAHLLKGTAAAVAQGEISALAQALENAFDYRKNAQMDGSVIRAADVALVLLRERLSCLPPTSVAFSHAAAVVGDQLLGFAPRLERESSCRPFEWGFELNRESLL